MKNVDSIKKHNNNYKFFVYGFLIIIFSFFAAFFIKRSFIISSKENITFQENSDLDYKVYLKTNDFYEKNYLEKDMVYFDSLIDRVDVNFNYLFKIDKKSDIDFSYDIVGKLVINDSSKNKTFFEKEYVLFENTKDSINGNKSYQISKNVSIDYGKYNSLANQFRTKYGVDTDSKLIVYLNVNENSNKISKFNNNSVMSLTIPLSERTVNITMDYEGVNKTSKLVRDKEFVISNKLFLVIGIILLCLVILFIVKYIRLLLSIRVKRSNFDKYVNRLLREYDRLIVETATEPNFDNKNIVEVVKFQELLDVRDNLKLPIKYYVVKKHKVCYFYIDYEEEVYFFRVTDNGLEER